jgi:thiamine pyrophosphokinase
MNTMVLCNGLAPPQSLFERTLHWADFFIAADGGANTARLMGHLPDVVIGDMDTYQPQNEEPYDIIHDPDQYSNDLEKALKLAVKKGATHLKVLGATGLRLDHTLKNLSVLQQFDEQFEQITFLDAQGTTQLLPRQFSTEIAIGTSVSLFPLSGKVTGITTDGLQYPLKDECLENGVRDGTSNAVVKNPVTINHKKGDLLLFIVN